MPYLIDTPHGSYAGETLKDAQKAMRKGAILHAKAENVKTEKSNKAYDKAQATACLLYERFLDGKSFPITWCVDTGAIKPGPTNGTRIVTLYGKDTVFAGTDVRLVLEGGGEPHLIYTEVCVYVVGHYDGFTQTRGLADHVLNWIQLETAQLNKV